MTTQPAGEHHTGTLNLTGQGNPAQSPISDELAATANGIFWNNYGTEQSYVVPDDGTRAMRLALEAAYPAIRQQVAEQIARALDRRHADNMRLANGDQDILPTDGRTGIATGYQRSAKIARGIGRGA